jgi:hypothetical protein
MVDGEMMSWCIVFGIATAVVLVIRAFLIRSQRHVNALGETLLNGEWPMLFDCYGLCELGKVSSMNVALDNRIVLIEATRNDNRCQMSMSIQDRNIVRHRNMVRHSVLPTMQMLSDGSLLCDNEHVGLIGRLPKGAGVICGTVQEHSFYVALNLVGGIPELGIDQPVELFGIRIPYVGIGQPVELFGIPQGRLDKALFLLTGMVPFVASPCLNMYAAWAYFQSGNPWFGTSSVFFLSFSGFTFIGALHQHSQGVDLWRFLFDHVCESCRNGNWTISLARVKWFWDAQVAPAGIINAYSVITYPYDYDISTGLLLLPLALAAKAMVEHRMCQLHRADPRRMLFVARARGSAWVTLARLLTSFVAIAGVAIVISPIHGAFSEPQGEETRCLHIFVTLVLLMFVSFMLADQRGCTWSEPYIKRFGHPMTDVSNLKPTRWVLVAASVCVYVSWLAPGAFGYFHELFMPKASSYIPLRTAFALTWAIACGSGFVAAFFFPMQFPRFVPDDSSTVARSRIS